jgi:hypothetical protein
VFERSCEGCLRAPAQPAEFPKRSPKFCFHCTYRYSILRHVITKPQTIGQLKRIFSETNRRRIHALIHDLEYEGVIKRDWDCLYHLRESL